MQPRIPADLGFYDLRLPETRESQAALAKAHGIEAFCYWHYWFGNGRQLLERPFSEVVSSGKPDLPFCLAWANQSWSGTWFGAPNTVLVEQTYPGVSDYEAHFNYLLPAFEDSRYLKVDGKLLFTIWMPADLPKTREFIDCWRSLAEKNGLPGFYFLAFADKEYDPRADGFDASIVDVFGWFLQNYKFSARLRKQRKGAEQEQAAGKANSTRHSPRRQEVSAGIIPQIYNYRRFIEDFDYSRPAHFTQYLAALSGWDNTPRCGRRGYVMAGFDAESFRKHLCNILNELQVEPFDRRLLFIRSWNEWAEGNYLEPDRQHGHELLQSVRDVVCI